MAIAAMIDDQPATVRWMNRKLTPQARHGRVPYREVKIAPLLLE